MRVNWNVFCLKPVVHRGADCVKGYGWDDRNPLNWERQMDLKGTKLLVIGGAGFIGSHTVDALLTEDIGEIRIYDNFARGSEENLAEALKDPRVKIFNIGGDILHRDILDTAMKGIDGVFHFAALWLLHCHEFQESAFEVNIRGTFNVLQGCIQNGVRRLVLSSSASVYGDAIEEPMTEDHPYNNKTFYGATKIAGEHIGRALYHRFRDTDRHFDYVGLRYMNVYGPRQDYQGAYIAVIMKILDRLEQGLPPIVYGDGSQAYDFIYVGDCAQANVCAMKSDATDSFYNVGTGTKTTIKELSKLILEIAGSPLEVQYADAGMTFVKNRVGCPKKAQSEINFTARIGLREGLESLILWREKHKEQVARLRSEVNL
jgi:UDP-glucose 4-epimerase